MAFRFLHSSDLHLGKPFGNLAEDLRGRLREARLTAIGRLAARADEQGAEAVLLAGDTFDTETPDPQIRRRTLMAMAEHEELRWVLLPGNHDSLQAAQLWDTLRAEAPNNVILATRAEPIRLTPEVSLLPAPCTTRSPGRDLTAWMDEAATAPGTLRIGLAHGAIRDFSEEAGANDIIAPDRAKRAGLDYLALGDWHGAVEVDDRTFYSGTPEPDRFKHGEPGQAHLVSIEAPGARPEVTQVETGEFSWSTIEFHLLAEEDGPARLLEELPSGVQRLKTLMRVAASGWIGLAGRTALNVTVERIRPEFAFLELDERGLKTECEPDDLDMIDRAGALRQAAEALLRESDDAARSPEEQAIARAALVRLFSYSQQVAR